MSLQLRRSAPHKLPDMVAERSVPQRSMGEGTQAMAGTRGAAQAHNAKGHVVYFDSWEALEQMPPNDVKQWLLSKRCILMPAS